MSVDFTPEMDSMQYQIACDCGAVTAKQVFPTFEVAYKIFNGINPIPFEKPVCHEEYCGLFSRQYRIQAVNEWELRVNMGSGNAYRVAEFLGLPVNDEMFGAMDGKEFLAKVQGKLAGITSKDFLTRAEVIEFNQSARRGRGYLEDVLARLETIASYAAERNAQVVWG